HVIDISCKASTKIIMPYHIHDKAICNNFYFLSGVLSIHNARLRGWQRITTKLKHNNCNHRGSMGLETPRVDSPS
ncbi:hypothetical protein AB1K44_17140, partial [Vibrio cholerae]|uniref:hypothetical protein n=1 Tax=Vibrio cholerae TaxID=666 RepID=UPI00345990B0